MLSTDVKFFPNQAQIFSSQTWGVAAKPVAPDVIASGPVSAEDYVDAAGRCSVQAGPSDAAVGTVAGDLAGPAAPQTVATVPGGIALGMTECQVVMRAGQAAQVNIGEQNGERKLVLTYPSGPWPGIYTFAAGRLKEIERVAQPEPPKPVKKRNKATRPATAAAPSSQAR